MSTHINLEYPWLSQSDINMFNTCLLKFKLSKLDNREKTHTFNFLQRGSDYHLIYNAFFDTIDLDKVIELVLNMRVLDDPYSSELCKYFKEVCWSLADKGYLLQYNDKPYLYDLNIEGFSRFEALAVAEIARIKGRVSKAMLQRYFVPQGREVFLKDDNLRIYGTIDSWFYDLDDTPYIADYKTGKAKASGYVSEDDGKIHKATISPGNRVQIWTYTYLLSRILGCEWKGMKGAMIYTKGDYPVAVSSKIVTKSMEGLINRINKIRDHVSNNLPYTPCYAVKSEDKWYVCPYCQYQGVCHDPETLAKFVEMRRVDGN